MVIITIRKVTRLPAEKVLEPNVRECLKAIDKKKGTTMREGLILYLEVGAMVKEAFKSRTLTYRQRVYNMWFAHFFLKFWKEWWYSDENTYPRSQRLTYLPSAQMYEAIEITATGLVLLILMMAKHFPNDPLFIDQITSSKLEQLFAVMRALGLDCKSSNTFAEFMKKARKSVLKTWLKFKMMMIQQNIQPEADQVRDYPAKVENLEEVLSDAVDEAKRDARAKLKQFLVLPPDPCDYAESQDPLEESSDGYVDPDNEDNYPDNLPDHDGPDVLLNSVPSQVIKTFRNNFEPNKYIN